VHAREDDDVRAVDFVDDAIWEAAEEYPARLAFDDLIQQRIST
jgi:hypothetical protein